MGGGAIAPSIMIAGGMTLMLIRLTDFLWHDGKYACIFIEVS